MQIKSVIIEDEKNNVELLKHFLSQYCKAIEVCGTAANATDGISLIRKVKPQLIFLDIILEEGTGFDILETLRELDIHVIFITAYDNHAIRAFKFSAIDYLLKPLQIDQLIYAVERAKKLIDVQGSRTQLEILISELQTGSSKNESIAISMIDHIEIIKLHEIEFIVADGKYSSFHILNSRTIISSTNIGEYEKLLLNYKEQFIRVHNSYIVNAKHIKSIQKSKDGFYCILNSEIEIPISRRKREKMLQQFQI